MNAATQLASEVGTTSACAAIGAARATFYRHRQVADRPCQEKPRPTPSRALSAEERRARIILSLSRGGRLGNWGQSAQSGARSGCRASDGIVLIQVRSTSATLHAWAIQPRGK